MKQLHPQAIWLFFLRYITQTVIVFFWLGGYAIFAIVNNIWLYVIIALVLSVGLAYLIARLSYRFYRYELTDMGFKKESGIIWKKYVTIPYDRIQNVDIHRGVLARILGLSDLKIQTAGMSGYGRGGGMMAEGVLPGLSRQDADLLRDELIGKSRGGTRNHSGV